jgi:DNA repair exonuclease SbcCD ATPase subunit
VSKLYRRPNMAENTIQIEVELKGERDVTKQLDNLKDGAKDVGEGFKGVTKIMDKSSAQIGEGLSTMSDAVGSSAEAVKSLKGAVSALGQGGASSFLGLVSPIALVTTAVAGLYEGFRQLSGAAKEAEDRQEAMAAASADLTSKLEALAEGGVIPTTSALLKFTQVTLQSQIAKELLQKQVEKSRPQMEAYTASLDAVGKAQDELNKLDAKGLKLSEEGLAARRRLTTAEMERDKAQGALNQRLKALQGPLQQNLELIAKAAKQEKELEENTTDNLKAKVKENAERLKTLQIAEQELYSRDALVLANAKEQISLEASNVARRAEDMERADLIKTIDQQTQAILELNQVDVAGRAQAAKARRQFAEADKKASEAERKRLEEMSKARARAAQVEETRQTLLQSQLNQLNIKLTKEGDEELLALARERYEVGLQLAKDDAMKRAVVQKQYQLEVNTIMDAAEEKEMARLDRLDKERMDRLKKQVADEQALRDKALREQQELIETLSDSIEKYGEGLAQAGVASLLFGEGFKKAAGEVLKGLAIESGVRALMMTADGLAKLFINPADAAASFKSAGLYAAAAGVARAGAGALGVGGGGGGGGTTASPSGAPQVASAPQREQAETSSTVVNINFGGAVIYDTQEAARRAMVNDIVQTYNRNPRGMARFNQQRMR